MKRFGFVKRKLQRSEDGVTAIEFAMLAPVFLALVFGVLQVSIAFHKGNTAQWAVKKAARAVLLNDDLNEAQIQELVDLQLKSIGEPIDLDIHYNVDRSGSVPIGRITAVYTHKVTVPAVRTFYAKFPIDVSVPHSIS